MIQKKSKFLYHSCERVDHGELPMNKVCIDSRCSSNSLVCGDCIRADHLNHQVVSLGEFVERLQNVNYASKLFADNSSLMKQLKELKIQSAMILERTRNALLEQLQKLDVVAGHYNIVERSLEDVSEDSNFYFAYDASADLAEINKNIRRAVKQYNSNASGGEKLRAMVGQCREDNELMEGLLEGTVRQLKDVVEQLCGIYNKPPLAISSNVLSSQPAMLPKVCSPQSAILSKPRLEWSQTLKHTDIQVEGSRARRTKDTTDNYWAVCLADLGTTTSWCIHIVQSKSMDLALGIITGSQAKRISYCKGSAKGKEIGELVLLDSLGCGGSCLRDAISGKKFPVKAGDVIQFDLDLSNLELHCSMNENKFVWSIDSLKPQDKYYACMFALVGDSVEIL